MDRKTSMVGLRLPPPAPLSAGYIGYTPKFPTKKITYTHRLLQGRYKNKKIEFFPNIKRKMMEYLSAKMFDKNLAVLSEKAYTTVRYFRIVIDKKEI